jgi:CMP-N,N'-diacetyllegionaminic acid synthase
MYKGKSFLAIIPARGGSKRIPKKNIKRLGGKPLLAWSVEEARRSIFIDDVCVTSDSEKILDVARSSGATIILKRPSRLATAASATIDAVLHAMARVERIKGKMYDYIILLQPTSPLRRASHIDNAIKNLAQNRQADSLVSFKKSHGKLGWIAVKDKNGIVKKIFGKKNTSEFWQYNGAIFITPWGIIKKNRSFETGRTLLFEMDRYSSIDIDTEEDFKYAQCILKEGLAK